MKLRNLKEVAKISFIEGVRGRALLGIFIVAVFFLAISLLIVPMFAFDTGKVAIDIGFAFVSLAGLSLIFFLAIPLLSRDIYQRTVTMILARPVTRAEYICGKFIGIALLIALAFAVIGFLATLSFGLGIHFIEEMELPRNFSWLTLAITVLLNFLAQLVLLAVGFLFTTMTTSAYLAMLLAFAVYISGQSLETIITIVLAGDFFQASEFHHAVLKATAWLIPNLHAFDIKVYVSYGLPMDSQYIMAIIMYGITYTLVLLSMTIFLFQRKELQ